MSDKRLIDANAVENHLFYTTRENDDYNEGYFDGVRDAKEIVRNSKTIDPETLRPKASWEPVRPGDDIWFKCSHCGCEISTSWDYDDPDDMWNYCPSCGAKMFGDG